MDAMDYAECYITGYMEVWKKWRDDYINGAPVMQFPVTESEARALALDKGLESWYADATSREVAA